MPVYKTTLVLSSLTAAEFSIGGDQEGLVKIYIMDLVGQFQGEEVSS